jgi:hypothetical protein
MAAASVATPAMAFFEYLPEEVGHLHLTFATGLQPTRVPDFLDGEYSHQSPNTSARVRYRDFRIAKPLIQRYYYV